MSPETGTMLVNEVVPRLRAAAPYVPATGHEDAGEILADMTANAAKMMDSAERAGKKFSPGNIAWYAGRAARAGRRSTGSNRTDVHSPGAQLDGRAHHEPLDAEMPDPLCREADGPHTPHDIVWTCGSAGHSDPSEEAGRNLDWQQFIAVCPPRQRVAILVLARGGTMREAGRLCGIGDSSALVLRKQLAAALLEFFGSEVIAHLLGGSRPAWEPDLRASREKHLCGAAHACEKERAA